MGVISPPSEGSERSGVARTPNEETPESDEHARVDNAVSRLLILDYTARRAARGVRSSSSTLGLHLGATEIGAMSTGSRPQGTVLGGALKCCSAQATSSSHARRRPVFVRLQWITNPM